MAVCTGITIKCFSKVSMVAWKFGSVRAFPRLLVPASSVLGRRYLFSSDLLGLENFKRLKHEFSEKVGPVKEKIVSNIETYLKSSDMNTVFTEDLKVMVYTAETDKEIELVVKMIHRYNLQNSELRFSNFTFGPLVMRLLYINNKPDLAYELYMDKTLSRFFDQISSARTLMDLLYENQRYDQVLSTMNAVRDKQIDGVRFQMDCVTLTAASCYHLNTEESLEKLITLLKAASKSSAVISHRSLCYGALLALNQEKPEIAQEILSMVKEDLITRLPVLYLNVKILTYASLGRAEQAINLIRGLLAQDLPDHVKFHCDIFEDVLAAVKEAASKQSASKEVTNMLVTVEKALRGGGHIPADVKLADTIDKPILRMRKLQDGYKNRSRPPILPDPRRSRASSASRTRHESGSIQSGLLD